MANRTSKNNRRKVMPLVMLTDAVVFPGCVHQFDVGRDELADAWSQSPHEIRHVFLMYGDEWMDRNDPDITGRMGVWAEVVQMLNDPNGQMVHVRVQGKCRAYGDFVNNADNKGIVLVTPVEEVRSTYDDKYAYSVYSDIMEVLIPHLNGLRSRSKIRVKNILKSNVYAKDDVVPYGEAVDKIADSQPFSLSEKQQLLECISHADRLELLHDLLAKEIEFAELDSSIEKQVNQNMDAAQREYYLHEKMRVISQELGDSDDPRSEAEEYMEKVKALEADEAVKADLCKECRKLAKLPFGSHEGAVLRGYLDVCLSLPWGKRTQDNLDVKLVEKKLNDDHYGMQKVKERILELIAVRALVPDIKGQIICLAGPPGVGKTSIARSIAEALHRRYVRVSLGGVHDEAEIRGHRKTYLGSMPGRIADAIIKAESMNPLILLDEIDKLASDYKGDPTSALLEVLDPEQNKAFVDHFLEIPLDLSEVLFITTANNIGDIPAPLYDRMEIIELPSYTHEEKLMIAKKYLLPKQIERCGLNAKTMKVSDTALAKLIEDYTREAGVRSLERELSSLCRRCAKKLVSGEAEKVSITARNLESVMGKPRFKRDDLAKELNPGMVNGLAWTSVGGEMLEIEVAVMEGVGKVELTGQLGEVMQESAKTAMSCIRQRAAQFGIAADYYHTKDIHIHVPEGAVPKDGPSAGITIATAILSALTGVSVRGDVAMTGEITLTGRVLAIGGLREKSMAALRAGIKTVIIPLANEPDVTEFSETVKNGLHFVPVKTFDEVIAAAFAEPPTVLPPASDE